MSKSGRRLNKQHNIVTNGVFEGLVMEVHNKLGHH